MHRSDARFIGLMLFVVLPLAVAVSLILPALLRQ